MKRKDNFETMLELLTELNSKIQIQGQFNHNDTAVHAENFVAELMNLLYGLNLSNLNSQVINAEGVDLIDSDNKIIIQVTSTCTKQKVENTLKKNIFRKYALEGYTLIFVFVGKQNSRIKNYTYSNPYMINFSNNNCLLTTKDLLQKLQSLSMSKQSEVIQMMEVEFPKLIDEYNLSKEDICEEILRILYENEVIWKNYGPEYQNFLIELMSEDMLNNWKIRKQDLFNNNETIMNLYNINSKLFTLDESKKFVDFIEHAKTFKLNDKNRLEPSAYKRFPITFKEMLLEIVKKED